MTKLKVVFTVEAPPEVSKEELKTSIAGAVTDAIPSEVPGATIRWTSIGGEIPPQS